MHTRARARAQTLADTRARHCADVAADAKDRATGANERVELAKDFCRRVGYPCLIRPSYVLSGAAMKARESERERGREGASGSEWERVGASGGEWGRGRE
eukprot:4276297-Pleurochrysis_carterae.AAC.2